MSYAHELNFVHVVILGVSADSAQFFGVIPATSETVTISAIRTLIFTFTLSSSFF